MFFESKIDVCNLDFLKSNSFGATYSDNLIDNTYTLSVANNIIEHRKVSITGGQYFILPLEKLQPGDIVVLEFDYLLVSGVSVNVVLKQNNTIVQNFKLPSSASFVNNSYSFVIKNNIDLYSSANRIEIGYATSEVGQYKLKDFAYKILRKKNIKKENSIGGMLYKTNGNTFMFHTGFINNISYSANGNTIRLTFDTSKLRVIPTITPLGLGNSLDYYYKIIAIQNSFIDFQVFDKTSNTQVTLDSLLTKEIWLSINVLCKYD